MAALIKILESLNWVPTFATGITNTSNTNFQDTTTSPFGRTPVNNNNPDVWVKGSGSAGANQEGTFSSFTNSTTAVLSFQPATALTTANYSWGNWQSAATVASTDTTHASVTLATTVQIGDVLAVLLNANPTVTFTISDTLGNTYTAIPNTSNNLTGNYKMQGFYCVSQFAGAVTINITYGSAISNGNASGTVLRLGNVDPRNPINASNSAQGTTGSPTLTLSTTIGDCFVFSWTGVGNGVTAGTSGFTSLCFNDANEDITEYKNGAAAGPVTSAPTQASGNWQIAMVAFAPNTSPSLRTQQRSPAYPPPMPVPGINQLGQGVLNVFQQSVSSIVCTMAAVGALSASISNTGAAGVGVPNIQQRAPGYPLAAPIPGLVQLGQGVLNPFSSSGALAAIFNGVGALSANLGGAGALADTMAGTGALSASLTATGALNDVMTGTGALSAFVSDTGAPGFAALRTQQSPPGQPPTATIPGIPLLGTGILNVFAGGPGSLTGIFVGTGALSAQLLGSGALADTMNGVGALSATLTGIGALADTMNGVGMLLATLGGTGALTDTMAGVGGLQAQIADIGAPGIASLPTQVRTVGYPPSAPLPGVIQLGSGILKSVSLAPGVMVGVFNGVGALIATPGGAGALNDVMAGTGALSASLGGTGALTDTLAGIGAFIANLQGSGALSDVMAATGALSAALLGSGSLGLVAAATGALGASLLGTGFLTVVVNAQGALLGTLGSGGSIGATMAAVGAFFPSVFNPLFATLNATGALSGNLVGFQAGPFKFVLSNSPV